MAIIKNSAFWNTVEDYYDSLPSTYNKEDSRYTEVSWAKNEQRKKVILNQKKSDLQAYKEGILKTKIGIYEITSDFIEAYCQISSRHGPYFVKQPLFIKYNCTFASKLTTFYKGQENILIEGVFLGLGNNNTIQLELISIESISQQNCFIATACYESIDAPKVIKLREFRDRFLIKSFYGRIFIKIYYFISPFIAKRIEKSSMLRRFVRRNVLDPFVSIIQNKL